MKKYLVVLPLISSCNSYNESNNMMENREVLHSESESQTNFMSISVESTKHIAVDGQGKKDSDNKNEGPVYEYGGDSVAYDQKMNKIKLVIADGVGSNWEYAGKMSSTMTYYAIESNYTEPEEILEDTCRKTGPAFKEIFEEVGRNSILDELKTYQESLEKAKNAENAKEIEFYTKRIKNCTIWLNDQKTLQSRATPFSFEKRPPATTINITTIDSGQLKWVNIGDSGLMVIRDKEIVHQSKQQREDRYATSAVALNKDGENYTTVSDPHISGTFQLNENDIVLLYTDGLSDNLSPYTIIKLINDNAERPTTEIIKIVVAEAVKASKGKRKDSFGGKKDDIAALMYIHKD